MYVEPTAQGQVSRAIYIRNIIRFARLFLPSIYKRWPGLKSFDICQEPEQVLNRVPRRSRSLSSLASRQAAASVDWKTHDARHAAPARVAGAAGKKGAKHDLSLYVSPRTLVEPSYQAAVAAAGVKPSSTSTSPSDEG